MVDDRRAMLSVVSTVHPAIDLVPLHVLSRLSLQAIFYGWFSSNTACGNNYALWSFFSQKWLITSTRNFIGPLLFNDYIDVYLTRGLRTHPFNVSYNH